jgi:hypothetical protein
MGVRGYFHQPKHFLGKDFCHLLWQYVLRPSNEAIFVPNQNIWRSIRYFQVKLFVGLRQTNDTLLA